MPEGSSEAGHLVLGSSPDPDLAAQYAASLDASHALTATLRDDKAGRGIDATLVDAATRGVIAQRTFRVPPGALQWAETEMAAWLVSALGVTATTDLTAPAAANEDAYRALADGHVIVLKPDTLEVHWAPPSIR